jgi:hypothetical protein
VSNVCPVDGLPFASLLKSHFNGTLKNLGSEKPVKELGEKIREGGYCWDLYTGMRLLAYKA